MSNYYGLPIFSWFLYNKYTKKNDIYLMCTLFANLYVLLMWGPHMVYMGTPYIFDIYMIRCGWLGGLYCYNIYKAYTAANIRLKILEGLWILSFKFDHSTQPTIQLPC